MSSVDKHNEEPDVYNYLRLSEPKDRGKFHAKYDAATPESGNFSLSSSTSSLDEMNEQQNPHAQKLTRMVKANLNRVVRPESNVTYDTEIISSAESSGVCTNSDGESSKNGTLTNSSTANLSTDSACQNATSSDEDEQAMQAKVIQREQQSSSKNISPSCELAVEVPVNTSLQASNLTQLSSGLHREKAATREEQQNKETIEISKKNNSDREHAVKNGALRGNAKKVEGTLENRTVVAGKKVAESAVKNTEFGNAGTKAFENKALEDKTSENGTFNFGDETFVDNPFSDEAFIDKSGNKRQHQSDEVKLYKQTRDSPYSPIYQPNSRDILNTSREHKILTKNHNLHNFSRANPNCPPKLRPQVLDPTLSSRSASSHCPKSNKLNILNQSDQNRTHRRRDFNSTEFNSKLSPKQQQIQLQQLQHNNSSQPSKFVSKPKSPHPVRRLQSFIHQKQRNKPVLVKRRSASDDEDEDDDFGEHWYNRRNSHASFNVKLAPVTSPASTTILKASPSLSAISPCASRTIYSRMHPNNREIVEPGRAVSSEYGSRGASIYSKAGSFFLTVASKVAENLRSTPTSPVKSDIARLGPVSEFGRQFTTNIKQSFSDMNLASYNNQRKEKQVSQRRLKTGFKNSPTKNTPTPDVLNTHFLNPAHAARNYKPHKNHVYDSKDSMPNVKRSHTTQDLCSFQGNTPDNGDTEPIYEEEEELEWDDYLPDTNSGNSPLCDDISSQVSSVATTNSSQYSSQYGSSQSSNDRCKIRNWGDQALTEISQMIQNDERDSVREVRESVREGAKVFDWPCHAIVDKLNVGLTIAEE